MIGEVEELAAELQVARLAEQRESFEQREIEVRGAGSDDDIAPGISEPAAEVTGEVVGVEPPLRIVREVVRIASDVGTRSAVGSGEGSQSHLHIKWISRLYSQDTVGLPAAQDHIGNAGPVHAVGSSPAERQVVGVAADEAIPRVERGQAALGAEVEDVQHGGVPGR